MASGSETITIIGAPAAAEVDWQGDPITGAGPAPERQVSGVMLVPRMSKDDPTLVLDGYQVLMLDTTQVPPEPEDHIKIRGTDDVWEIDGNVGDFGKSPDAIKVFMFVIQRPR